MLFMPDHGPMQTQAVGPNSIRPSIPPVIPVKGKGNSLRPGEDSGSSPIFSPTNMVALELLFYAVVV